MYDYDISKEFSHLPINQIYAKFLSIHVNQQDNKQVYELYSCSPLLPIRRDNKIEFQVALYEVDELQ